MTTVDFHPLADREAKRSRRYYDRRNRTAGARLTAAVRAAIARIAATPLACSTHHHGTRFCPVKKFPYYLVFIVQPTRALVLAVAHTRQRPGYWVRRLPRP